MQIRSPARQRVESVDLLRGVVMVIMALDHTRDYFGLASAGNPTNPDTTTAALFFTRWITHICAPSFFLLTGVGAALTGAQRTTASLSRLLLTRGAWLIVAEVTLSRFAFQFNVDYKVTGLIVFWALGCAMICLGLLVWLPRWAIVAFGAVMILGHNAFDAVRSTNPLWMILHQPGVVWQGGDRTIWVLYPLVPWLGVTALGYVLGGAWQWEADKRDRFLLRAGVAMTVGFVALRALNLYGDPFPWASRPDAIRTAFSFFNATKYPASLLFLLMTLGPALLLLRAWSAGTPAWLRPVVVYGRVPFFYFVVHFALIHLIAVAFCLVRYGDAHWMFESPTLAQYPFIQPPGWGYSLLVVYAIWVSVVAAMYLPSRWFARVKAERRSVWLSYL